MARCFEQKKKRETYTKYENMVLKVNSLKLNFTFIMLKIFKILKVNECAGGRKEEGGRRTALR